MRINKITKLALLLTISANSYATNGYYPIGFGAKSKGMGGATTAHITDALGGIGNPAQLSHIGNQYGVSLTVLDAPHGFVAESHTHSDLYPVVTAGAYDSTKELFFGPGFAYNKRINEKSTYGVNLSGGGGATKFDATIFDYFDGPLDSQEATSPAGVEMTRLRLGFPYSVKTDEINSFAIEPIINAQVFEAYGGEPFRRVSIHPDHVTNNGRSWSYGVGIKLGWYGEIDDKLSLGATFEPKTNMSKFDKYKGLFAEEGDFDIPSSLSLGIAYKTTPKLTITADYQKINYGDIKSLANTNSVALVAGQSLGGSDGLGGGWVDANVKKIGLEWIYNDNLRLRAGYNKVNNVISGAQTLINIVSPAVNDEHFTIGGDYKLDKNSEISFSINHAPKREATGWNPNTGGVTGQQGTIFMKQTEYEISKTWKF